MGRPRFSGSLLRLTKDITRVVSTLALAKSPFQRLGLAATYVSADGSSAVDQASHSKKTAIWRMKCSRRLFLDTESALLICRVSSLFFVSIEPLMKAAYEDGQSQIYSWRPIEASYVSGSLHPVAIEAVVFISASDS